MRKSGASMADSDDNFRIKNRVFSAWKLFPGYSSCRAKLYDSDPFSGKIGCYRLCCMPKGHRGMHASMSNVSWIEWEGDAEVIVHRYNESL